MLRHHEGHFPCGMGSLKITTLLASCRFEGSVKAISMIEIAYAYLDLLFSIPVSIADLCLESHLWDGGLSRWCFAGLLAGQRLRRSSQRLASICRRPSSSHAAFSCFLVLAGSVVLPVCFNCICALQSSLLLGLLRQHPGIDLKGRLHGHTWMLASIEPVSAESFCCQQPGMRSEMSLHGHTCPVDKDA